MEISTLPGQTIHMLRGSKYAGVMTVDSVEDAGQGWYWLRGSCCQTSARPEDVFATEAEARTEGRARRQPRRQRVVSGEWGMAILLTNPGAKRAR
jgi:hypothetical protein